MDFFPYGQVRSGQKDFIKDVAGAVSSGKHLVAHAPTGIGKTVGVLSPVLEHVLSHGQTVFFLTPKHTQHVIVVDTLKKIQKKTGLNITCVDIIGKQWMCPHKLGDLSSREFNEYCRSRKKDETCTQYNNVRKVKLTPKARKVIGDLKGTVHHNEHIRNVCDKHELCPYEVCVELGKHADIVVCDYFHIFSPPVCNAFLTKLEKHIADSVIIVDEAHNLPDRVRGILSNSLGDYSIKRGVKEASAIGSHDFTGAIEGIGSVLKALSRGVKGEVFIARQDLESRVSDKTGYDFMDLANELESIGDEVLNIPGRYRSFTKAISNFMNAWMGKDIGFARILRKNGKNINLDYKCLDPSISCGSIFDEAYGSVLMSGTLVPLKMYSDVLGLKDSRTIERAYRSPFPSENRLNIIVSGVTTKYSNRSDFMYGRYAKHISDVISHVPGNIAVFFPSYGLLELIVGRLDPKRYEKEFLLERQGMRKDERIRIFERLVKLHGGDGGVLFGVQAGGFSEGLDYADNLLDCVAIVGLPLEHPDLETQSLIDFYDFKFERGWDYGYIYPAMNRSLQAAGRCIRSETDRGVVLFMDERFKWGNYIKCFPQDFEFSVTETPGKYLERFYIPEATEAYNL